MKPLESFDAERADFEKVFDAIRRIDRAPLAELQSLEWLVEMTRGVGLVPIPEAENAYADEAVHLNSSQQGVIQLPREFARWLLLAAEHRPASYLEIGCFNGATAALATAYLRRFNADFRAVTIDLWPAFLFYDEVRTLLPLRYEVPKTSFDFRDAPPFDAVFIDGDHSFDWAWADYRNAGRAARLCALHDVNNGPYRELAHGGVPAVWDLIKRDNAGPGIEFVEIFEHSRGQAVMGIGVRVRGS